MERIAHYINTKRDGGVKIKQCRSKYYKLTKKQAAKKLGPD